MARKKINSFQYIKESLNGRKTTIGGILAFATFMAYHNGIIDTATYDALDVLSMAVLGIGLTHKIIKAQQ